MPTAPRIYPYFIPLCLLALVVAGCHPVQTLGGKRGGQHATTQAPRAKKHLSPPRQNASSVEALLMAEEIPPPPAPAQTGVGVRVSLSSRRAWLYENGAAILAAPITPGKSSTPTPKGKFHVLKKHRHWVSTIYNVPMPYFLRLNPWFFGLHQGPMRMSPASHGCVRLPEYEASLFFSKVGVGAPVWIEN